jgi:hypothetical protein
MTRRLLVPCVFAALFAAVPAVAEAQHDFSFTSFTPRHTSGRGVAGPWASLDFGAPRFVPEPRLDFVTRSSARPRSPLGHPGTSESPWRWAPSSLPDVPILKHRAHSGDLFLALTPAVRAERAIDCAMAKPGDMTLDPRFVVPPPSRLTHSGVIVPVAPCIRK